MLLRTVALLLLCVSAGMCATLGHYQAEAKEEEAPAVADGVVEAATVDAAEEGGDAKVADPPAAEEGGDAKVVDPPAAEEPTADPLFGDDLPAETPTVDDPAADEPQVDVPVADGATAEEPGTDSDRPAGDAAAVEAVTGEAVTHDQPSEEEKEEEGNEIRPVQTDQSLDRPLAQEDNSWSLNSIRSSFQTVHGYFDSLVELVGGQDGVCQYRCRYGELPQPRPGYQPSEPDGCSSSLVGFQLDLGIPAMTQCCNQLDVCYETCGTSKYDCDAKFRSCLHDICSDVNKSLGFVNKVKACETMADTLFNTVWSLGCRSYMNGQRAACVCEGEERDEL